MLISHFLRAQRAHQEQRCLWVEAQQVVQPFQRLLITPLQIVEQQQQRLARGQGRSRQRLKQVLALPTLHEWAGVRQVRSLHEEIGYESRHFGEPGSWKC